MCNECKRDVRGTIYCEACLQREMHAPTAPAGPPAGPIPGLALGLGFIPGVGAIYNGQYAKAFVHVIIFGVLISILANNQAPGFEALFGMLIPCFVFYMAFKAFHTARKRVLGQPVDEWSGLFSNPGDASAAANASAPSIGPRSGGALFLIGFGVLLLLSNLGYLHLSEILKWWPLLLIGLGASMLVSRLGDGPRGGQ
jgi:hypothetical protein